MLKKSVLIAAVISFTFLPVSTLHANRVGIVEPILGSRHSVEGIDSVNNTAFNLVFSNQEKVIKMMRENYPFAWAIKDTNGYLTALNILGIAYDIRGLYDSSGYYFNKTLNLSRLYKNMVIEEKSLNNLGMMNWNLGNLFIAQQYFFESLKLSESYKNEKRASVALSNIGLIYQELSLYEKALAFHRRALDIREKEPTLRKDIPLSYNNMAICFQYLHQIDSAIILINNGLKMAHEFSNRLLESNLLTTMGNCNYMQNDYKNALKNLLESVQIKLELCKETSLHKTYNSLSETYFKMDNLQMALNYALKSKESIVKSGVNYDFDTYANLSQAYFALGNRAMGQLYFERANAVRDSVFSNNSARSFAELEVLHEVQQKESDLSKFKGELAGEQLKVQSRNFSLALLGIGLLFLLILATGFYKKQKFKKEQFQKELELRDKLAQAETQNQLNNERMRISKDLHDNIGSQLTLVTSSLDNLSYKSAGVGEKARMEQISGFTKFAIRQLRDTIWALNRNEFSIDDLHLRILDFINKARQSCPQIKFESQIAGDRNLSLTPEQGINLLYVIQETINNSIKYADCTSIRYQMNAENCLLEIKVQDNGKGFFKEEVKVGNGLVNIDSRITKVNGHYTLDTAPGKGTSLLVNLKI